jgi:hypothetical protein
MPFYKRLRRSLSTLKACVSEEVVYETGSAEGAKPLCRSAIGGWGYLRVTLSVAKGLRDSSPSQKDQNDIVTLGDTGG